MLNLVIIRMVCSKDHNKAGLPNADLCHHLWKDDSDKGNENTYDSDFETVLAQRYLKFKWETVTILKYVINLQRKLFLLLA